MDDLLANIISLPALFLMCLASGTLVPMPEDVPVLVAGISSATGGLAPGGALAVSMVGVLCRDILFYGAGRFLGEQVLHRPFVVRLVGAAQLEKARELLGRRGAQAVLMGRFLIGFRTPVFLTAGVLGVPLRSFLLWDGIGLIVMIPLMFGLGYLFGEPALAWLQWVISQSGVVIVLLGVVGALVLGWQVRRRMLKGAELPGAPGEDA